MDIIKELWDKNLPNFGYVIDMDNGSSCVVVLGGQSAKKTDQLLLRNLICSRNEQMQKIYCKENLSVNDKIALAELMKKMYLLCDSRKDKLYTRAEQKEFIDSLSVSEKLQLEYQIKMLKDCRRFYYEFIFK